MAANYNKLWKLLIDKGMTKTDLRMKTGMSTSTLAKMSNNENVSMEIILRICEILECNVGDVMDATKKED
jgi:DNA-binding Xre family transcriptional regulator